MYSKQFYLCTTCFLVTDDYNSGKGVRKTFGNEVNKTSIKTLYLHLMFLKGVFTLNIFILHNSFLDKKKFEAKNVTSLLELSRQTQNMIIN